METRSVKGQRRVTCEGLRFRGFPSEFVVVEHQAVESGGAASERDGDTEPRGTASSRGGRNEMPKERAFWQEEQGRTIYSAWENDISTIASARRKGEREEPGGIQPGPPQDVSRLPCSETVNFCACRVYRSPTFARSRVPLPTRVASKRNAPLPGQSASLDDKLFR